MLKFNWKKLLLYILDIDLNTSYVKVQSKETYEKIENGLIFKYILC